MDGGAWRATVRGVAESQTQPSTQAQETLLAVTHGAGLPTQGGEAGDAAKRPTLTAVK